MADALKKAAVWLGLYADRQYDDGREDVTDDELTQNVYEDEYTESVAAEDTNVTALESRRPSAAPAVRSAAPSTPKVADISRIITVHPRTYNEARTIGEHFRDGVPVIMNLSDMEDVDAKRLVDFAAGLIFGLRGTIERITSKVFLLSPQNVNVAAEDKERIAGGFFNQS